MRGGPPRDPADGGFSGGAGVRPTVGEPPAGAVRRRPIYCGVCFKIRFELSMDWNVSGGGSYDLSANVPVPT